ncbi:MAG: glycosyltransferase [Bacteroidales bacterium]
MIFDFLQTIQWGQIPLHQYILFGVFSLAALIQLIYYTILFRRVANFKPCLQQETIEPVSLVIRTKNEYHNLKKNLPLFLGQNHPKFEVIVVNDASSDETEELLYTLKPQYKNLVITTIEQEAKFLHNKKLAITIGIKAARYDCILFTEPDCTPPSNQWLQTMQKGIGQGEILLSYCRKPRANGLANSIMRCDDVISATYWLYAAMQGKPYRGDLKNMGFRQNLFLSKKGFAHYNSFQSSEETIFLCRNGNKENTKIILDKNAILTSSDNIKFGQWMRQKSLYAALLSMGGRGITRMRMELISRCFFYLTFAAILAMALINNDLQLLIAVMPMAFLRAIVVICIHYKLLKKLQEKGLFITMMFYDIVAPLICYVTTLTQPNLHKIKKVK